MELSFLLFQKIVAMAAMMMMGFAIVKSKLLKSEQSAAISTVNLYMICPCMILMAFQLEYTTERLRGLLIAFVAAVLVHVVLIPFTKVLGNRLHLDIVERTSLIYSNAGNLILPLVSAILGTEYVFYCCAFLMVQTSLHWFHLNPVMAGGGKIQLKKILSNPNILSIIVGLICFFGRITFPAIVVDIIKPVGDMVGPTAMIMMGMLMADVDLKMVFSNKRYYAICFGRLIGYPLLIMLLTRLSQVTVLVPGAREVLMVTMMAACAPVAVTVTQMANITGQDAKKASAINVMTIIFCIITMPVMIGVYQWMC